MTILVDTEDRLDRYLAKALPMRSRTRIVEQIEGGAVTVNGVVRKPSFKLSIGMVLEIPDEQQRSPHDLTPADIPIEILYEDDDLMVVVKPRGLPTHPAPSYHGPTLVNALLSRPASLSSGSAEFRPGIVHRLDKDTTGLLIVAKNDTAHHRLAEQIQRKEADRRYVAVVKGTLDRKRFSIDAPLARTTKNRLQMAINPLGKPAITHVKEVSRLDSGTLVAVRLETGRTHQIRVHLKAIGHPVKGDGIYADQNWSKGPMQLHAAWISFRQPMSGDMIAVYVEPPTDFEGRDFVKRDQIESW